MCVGGVFLFVGVAAFTAVDKPVTDRQLVVILIILAVVLAVAGITFVLFRTSIRAIYYVIMAGVLYGFVATLAKVVLGKIEQGEFGWLTMLCLVGLLAATALGAYFVQNAYASGPPDLVIAGLTVVDPLVAVVIGIVGARRGLAGPALGDRVVRDLGRDRGLGGLPARQEPPADPTLSGGPRGSAPTGDMLGQQPQLALRRLSSDEAGERPSARRRARRDRPSRPQEL